MELISKETGELPIFVDEENNPHNFVLGKTREVTPGVNATEATILENLVPIDKSKSLKVITIQPNLYTSLQKVSLEGATVHIAILGGHGVLVIFDPSTQKFKRFILNKNRTYNPPITVEYGQYVQVFAASDSYLAFFEYGKNLGLSGDSYIEEYPNERIFNLGASEET